MDVGRNVSRRQRQSLDLALAIGQVLRRRAVGCAFIPRRVLPPRGFAPVTFTVADLGDRLILTSDITVIDREALRHMSSRGSLNVDYRSKCNDCACGAYDLLYLAHGIDRKMREEKGHRRQKIYLSWSLLANLWDYTALFLPARRYTYKPANYKKNSFCVSPIPEAEVGKVGDSPVELGQIARAVAEDPQLPRL